MSGIIGKKIGMTSLFDENGKNMPCTVIQAGPCSVLQVRTIEKDGYKAAQLGFDDKSEKNVGKALAGHFKKAGSAPKAKLVEFYHEFVEKLSVGDEVKVDLFAQGEFVDVTGTSTTTKMHPFLRKEPQKQKPKLRKFLKPVFGKKSKISSAAFSVAKNLAILKMEMIKVKVIF
jgi:50S ribosomal protein uL3